MKLLILLATFISSPMNLLQLISRIRFPVMKYYLQNEVQVLCKFNLSSIASKIRTFVMFTTVDVQQNLSK